MGIQGSGKGTQATLLADDLDLEHFSVGEIFRWNVQHHTKLGAQVKRTIDSGNLVEDDLVEAVIRRCLADHDWNFGFVIDGFPRTARQAEFFLERYDIDGVINLELPDEDVARRVLSRRLCADWGWTTTSSVTGPIARVCATSVEENWSHAPTTTRLRWRSA